MSLVLLRRALDLAVLLCTLLAAFLGWRAHDTERRKPVAFTVSLVGERESAPGVWAPLDPLEEPSLRLDDHFQLRIRAASPGHLAAFALHPGGRVQRLLGGSDTAAFAPGEAVVLPARGHFYRLEGAPLSIVVIATRDALPILAQPSVDPGVLLALAKAEQQNRGEPWAARLSDGTPIWASTRTVQGRGLAGLHLSLEAEGAPGDSFAPPPPGEGAGGQALSAGMLP